MIIDYYIINIVIWGLYLRYMLFIKTDIREELKKNWDLNNFEADRYLFRYWLLFTVFWPLTILLILLQAIVSITKSGK